ncbi:MAG: hypothetical protein HGA69_00250 [Desulfobulbaceae bacterium]|nr:hypothetical protein [Desulfobulbaceae bacterium]
MASCIFDGISLPLSLPGFSDLKGTCLYESQPFPLVNLDTPGEIISEISYAIPKNFVGLANLKIESTA